MTASPVIEEAPASSIVYCSQYRMKDYERKNRPLPGHEKVGAGSGAAPRREGSVRGVRRAVALPDAAWRSTQGSMQWCASGSQRSLLT